MIEDVIRNVRSDFLDMGVDEQVLFELQEVWNAHIYTMTDDVFFELYLIRTHLFHSLCLFICMCMARYGKRN